MPIRRFLYLLPLCALPAVAAAQTEPGAVTDEVRAQIEACARYKFETIVEMTVDGQPRKQRVQLCGTQAKTDADWARTLREMIGKVEADQRLAPQAKVQIVTALRNEIAKVDAPAAVSGIPSAPVPAPVIPVALPPAPVAPAISNSGRLTIACLQPGGGGVPCDDLEPSTRLLVRAESALPAGATLKFLRRGDLRAEVAVPALSAGQTQRITLPRQLCAGVHSTRIEIAVSGPGAAAATFGPFPLRC